MFPRVAVQWRFSGGSVAQEYSVLHNSGSWNPYSTVVSRSKKVEVRGVEPEFRLSNRKGFGLFFFEKWRFGGGSVFLKPLALPLSHPSQIVLDGVHAISILRHEDHFSSLLSDLVPRRIRSLQFFANQARKSVLVAKPLRFASASSRSKSSGSR